MATRIIHAKQNCRYLFEMIKKQYGLDFYCTILKSFFIETIIDSYWWLIIKLVKYLLTTVYMFCYISTSPLPQQPSKKHISLVDKVCQKRKKNAVFKTRYVQSNWDIVTVSFLFPSPSSCRRQGQRSQVSLWFPPTSWLTVCFLLSIFSFEKLQAKCWEHMDSWRNQFLA